MSMSIYLNDEIKSFDPFFVDFDTYDGRHVYITFTCPYCGGHSVKRCKNAENNRHYYESNFRCLTCCKGSYNGEPFYYASPAFVHRYDLFTQLTLF